MNKKWYQTSFMKAILILFEHLAVLGIVLSITGLLMLSDYRVTFDDFGKKDYLQTTHFSVDMRIAAEQILSKLYTERSLNALNQAKPDAVIDVAAAFEIDGKDLGTNDQIYKNTSGFAYSVQDLLGWSKEYRNRSNNLSPKIIVCLKKEGGYDYYTLDDFEKLLKNGTLFPAIYYGTRHEAVETLLEKLESTDYLNMAETDIYQIEDRKGVSKYVDFWTYNSDILEEKYAPVGYDSILDMVNTDPNWNGKLGEAYQNLIFLLEKLSALTLDSNVVNEYSEGKTNFRYLFADLDNRKMYSNIPGCTLLNYEKKIEEIRESGVYAIGFPGECEDTLDNTYFGFWEVLNQNITAKSYAFALTLDTSYPISDYIAKDVQNFAKYAPYLNYVLLAGSISILVFLFCLVWLTLVAGRRSGSNELHLTSFDHWYTEIAAAVVVVPWVIIMSAGFTFCDGNISGYTGACIALSLMGLFTGSMFLWGYLSLVRRIKAKLFWKNSLTRKLFLVSISILEKLFRGSTSLLKRFFQRSISFLKRLFRFGARCTDHLSSVLKAGLGGGLFLGLQFILCAFIFAGAPVGLLFLCIIDCLAVVYLVRKAEGLGQIQSGLRRITDGEIQYKIPLLHLRGEQKTMAESINSISEGLDAAIENSLKNERTKTELITNVSHDIKTPLTSIINYVDLLKRENIEDEKIQGYLTIIDTKAHQLKVLTEDIVEASKASSGNLTLEMTELDFLEMIQQVMGEFQEKYAAKNLTMISSFPEPPVILHIDGRRMWRVLENIFGNVEKYALPGTRVYIDLVTRDDSAVFSLKNISAQALNISADELTERFIRGDISRNTEGSGLGLSIAKSLVQLQGGTFQLYLDGDLFKVEIEFTRK